MTARALPPPLPLDSALPGGAAVGEASSGALDITGMAESIPPGSRGEPFGGGTGSAESAYSSAREDEEWELPISEIQDERAPEEAMESRPPEPPREQAINYMASPDADSEWELPISEIQDDDGAIDGPTSVRPAHVESPHHVERAAVSARPVASEVSAYAPPPPQAHAPAPQAHAPAPLPAAAPPPAAPPPATAPPPAAAAPPAAAPVAAPAPAPATTATPSKPALAMVLGDAFHGDEHRWAGPIAAALAAAVGSLFGILAAVHPAPPPSEPQAAAHAPRARHVRKVHVAKSRAAHKPRAEKPAPAAAGAPVGSDTDGIDLAELRRVLEKARRGPEPAPTALDPHAKPAVTPSAKPSASPHAPPHAAPSRAAPSHAAKPHH